MVIRQKNLIPLVHLAQMLVAPQEEVHWLFVTTEVDEVLTNVVYHSFERSLISAFESNGIAATLRLLPDKSEITPELQGAVESFAPNATMHIRIEPLYRTHREGYEAVVGTVFDADLKDADSGQELWQLPGQVEEQQRRALIRRLRYGAFRCLLVAVTCLSDCRYRQLLNDR